ncbi:MAG TPA: hypothetical protein VGM23_15280, partial [Armatimonadota bacterium]
RAYPRYLDNFDNAGLGIWWMPMTKTPEQMAWFKDMPAAGNMHGQTLQLTPAPGVYDISGPTNAKAQMREAGKTYRQMLWCGSGGEGHWLDTQQLPGDNGEMPTPGYIGGRRLFDAGGYNGTQVASPVVNTLLQDALVQMMRAQAQDPNLLAWMEPHGEFHLQEPDGMPPSYQSRFPAYLQLVKRYSLETLSEAYTGKRTSYTDWSQAPIPDTAYYYGRRGQVLDLDDILWRWKPGPLADGMNTGWTDTEFNDGQWPQNRREDKRLLSQFFEKGGEYPLWYRFTHDVSAAYLKATAGKPIYLHILPYTYREGKYVTVWINGRQVGKELQDTTSYYTDHVQVDVSAALKPGANQFTIYSNGGRIAYRVFLSDVRGEAFPSSDKLINHQFLDWRDYLIWEKLQTLETYLRVMRSVDPVRPIKVMTPHLFQSEAMDLFERYGAYPQLTGEGAGFYRPMHYKGYSRLRGLPGSSEPGGPSKDAPRIQGMFANIFWESQDTHDYVFDLNRDLWPYKDVVQWYSNNKPLLRTLGKTDFAEIKLGVLRDVRQDARYSTGLIWNWDMSRGPLPSLGLTPVLVDGRDFELGLADRVPVILDCATTVMEPSMVDAVRRYVAQGGIFVAQHHTGEHSVDTRDAWPLPKAFGFTVEPKLISDENFDKWPVGKIRFTDDETLLPSLRGKTVEGSGVSIDSQNNERTGAVTIRGEASNLIPIARWEDGSLAVAEVRYGRGRFIFLGTPFYLRIRDVQGRWFNDDQRQALVEELLTSLGVTRETQVGDDRCWFERRESKNGLYDVYFAGMMGIRDKEYKLETQIPTELSARRPAAIAAIEPTAEGSPDVPTRFADGRVNFGTQTFSPFQIRQFAVVRDDAGLEGPLHWLDVQHQAWRALEPVSPVLADTVTAEAVKFAATMGEAGLNLNDGWRVRRDPADAKDTAWVTADTAAAEWADGSMGSWISKGWSTTTCVQYRQRVDVPAAWRDGKSRILLGMVSYWSLGIQEKGQLWINGKIREAGISGWFLDDITADAADGKLDLAMQVDSAGLNRGPIGTLYLRRVPLPVETFNITDGW